MDKYNIHLWAEVPFTPTGKVIGLLSFGSYERKISSLFCRWRSSTSCLPYSTRKANAFANASVSSVLCHPTFCSMKMHCFVFLTSLSFLQGQHVPALFLGTLLSCPSSNFVISRRDVHIQTQFCSRLLSIAHGWHQTQDGSVFLP